MPSIKLIHSNHLLIPRLLCSSQPARGHHFSVLKRSHGSISWELCNKSTDIGNSLKMPCQTGFKWIVQKRFICKYLPLEIVQLTLLVCWPQGFKMFHIGDSLRTIWESAKARRQRMSNIGRLHGPLVFFLVWILTQAPPRQNMFAYGRWRPPEYSRVLTPESL